MSATQLPSNSTRLTTQSREQNSDQRAFLMNIPAREKKASGQIRSG